MNNSRVLIIAGVVSLLIVVGVMVLLLQPRPNSYDGSTEYTDATSGQRLTNNPPEPSHEGHEGEGEAILVPNAIPITGLEDFLPSLEQDQSESIINDLTVFIRARVGARPTAAGVMDSRIQQVKADPLTYEFTLALQQPATQYRVSLVIPDTYTTPTLSFSEVTQ